jgi:hypothetical protein
MSEIIRDPIWQFLGVLAAIIIGFISIYLYLRDRNRKALSYEVISNTSLVVVKDEVKEKLKIFYDEKPVSQLYLSLIRIVNSGNVPILASDFTRTLTLSLAEETQIVSAEIIERHPKLLEATVGYRGNEATVNVMLLNGGDSLTVKILSSGARSMVTVDGRIVGVGEIKVYTGYAMRYLMLVLLGIIILGTGEVFGLAGNPVGWVLFILGAAMFAYGWKHAPLIFARWRKRESS